jgi:hypothetical protein
MQFSKQFDRLFLNILLLLFTDWWLFHARIKEMFNICTNEDTFFEGPGQINFATASPTFFEQFPRQTRKFDIFSTYLSGNQHSSHCFCLIFFTNSLNVDCEMLTQKFYSHFFFLPRLMRTGHRNAIFP